MKRKILRILILCSCSVLISYTPVNAIPSNSEVARDQHTYDEMSKEIEDQEIKLQKIDAELTATLNEANDLKHSLAVVEDEMNTLRSQQKECADSIAELEVVLSQRIRGYYETGCSVVTYYSSLFATDSLTTLVDNLKKFSDLIDADAALISDCKGEKEHLVSVEQELQEASDSQKSLLSDVEKKQQDLSSLESEQKKAVESAKLKRKEFDDKFLSVSESNLVNPLISAATDSSKTSQQIQENITLLQQVLAHQLKSEQVISKVNSALISAESLYRQKQDQEAAEARASASSCVTNTFIPLPSEAKSSALITCASQFLGLPYVWGGSDPSGFDCSGLVQWCFKHALNVDLPRTTYEQIKCGVHVDRANIQPGDLVFPHEGHVQIYVGNGCVLHAPQTGDVVKVSEMRRVYEIRRIV